MRNKHPGPCYRCGENVGAGEGHFERHKGGWRLQHATCAIKYRGTDKNMPERPAVNRAALQTERVGDSKIVPDPRPELKYDSAEWTRLLARVEAFDPMCAGVLHGFRCGGLRLHRGGKGYTLRPEFDPATSIWADESAYKADRDAWLVPHTEVIITALRWLGSPVEAAEHAVATGNVTVIVE